MAEFQSIDWTKHPQGGQSRRTTPAFFSQARTPAVSGGSMLSLTDLVGDINALTSAFKSEQLFAAASAAGKLLQDFGDIGQNILGGSHGLWGATGPDEGSMTQFRECCQDCHHACDEARAKIPQMAQGQWRQAGGVPSAPRVRTFNPAFVMTLLQILPQIIQLVEDLYNQHATPTT